MSGGHHGGKSPRCRSFSATSATNPGQPPTRTISSRFYPQQQPRTRGAPAQRTTCTWPVNERRLNPTQNRVQKRKPSPGPPPVLGAELLPVSASRFARDRPAFEPQPAWRPGAGRPMSERAPIQVVTAAGKPGKGWLRFTFGSRVWLSSHIRYSPAGASRRGRRPGRGLPSEYAANMHLPTTSEPVTRCGCAEALRELAGDRAPFVKRNEARTSVDRSLGRGSRTGGQAQGRWPSRSPSAARPRMSAPAARMAAPRRWSP